MTPQKLQKLLNLIKVGVLWAKKNVWGHGTKVHAKFWPWGTPWDPSYDHFWVLCWPSFSQYSIFWCMWGYMKVYKAICRYMKVYGGIWSNISIYKRTFSTLFFFQLFEGLRCVWGAFEVRLKCVWSAFEVRLKCVWDAFEERLRCVWGAFEARLKCVWVAFEERLKRVWSSAGGFTTTNHHHIKAFRALDTNGAWE